MGIVAYKGAKWKSTRLPVQSTMGTRVGLGIEHTYEVFGDSPGEVIKII